MASVFLGKEWEAYVKLLQNYPNLLRGQEVLEIVTDARIVEAYCKENKKKVGLIYQDDYIFLLVDLVKNSEGDLFTYHRVVPCSENESVVIIPKYQNKYVVLVQFRHAIRQFQQNFPRGFGENAISIVQNAEKELVEELGCQVLNTEILGEITPDSGLSAMKTKVCLCEISKPFVKGGYEGIENLLYLTKEQFSEKIRQGEITDSFTLAAWTLLNEKEQK